MCYVSGLISVIVPVFNVKDYLDRCMESIVNQTYANIEIIVIDDGSDDGSTDMCDSWQRKDGRIRVYHKKNGGLSSARNLGLRKAKGEYVGFVDSDDYIKEDMYEALLKDMGDGVDITCCGTVILYPVWMNRQNEVYDNVLGKKIFTNKEAVKELLLKRALSFSSCNKLFRRNLFRQIAYPIGKTSEDLPVTYELFKKSRGVVNIGKTKYCYCYRENSISRKAFEVSRVDYVLFARDILKDVMLHYPDERKAAEALYIRNVMAIIQEIDMNNGSDSYKRLRNRFRKLLCKMYVRVLRNEYISSEMKRDILQVMIGLSKDNAEG